MVTTHLRARAAQAGALLAVIVGGVLAAPGVALADPPEVQITNLTTEVESGGTVTMQYQVTPDNEDGGNGGGNGRVGVRLQVQADGMKRCQGASCGQITTMRAQGDTFTVRLEAPDLNPGETRDITVRAIAVINGEEGRAEQNIKVKGADKPQSVRQVSGKVKNADGKAVSGATVGVKDSQGNTFSDTTNGSGGFSVSGTDSKPIAPGNLTVGAAKDGFEPASVQAQGQSGRSLNVNLTLKATAATASPTPSATATASPTSAATDEITDEPTTGNSALAQTDTQNTSNNEDGGGSWLYIIIGGLLVAAGVGAIVLVFLRRKNNNGGPGDDDDPTGFGGPGGVVPPSQGRFNDATRVGAPMGAGPAAATMVAPRSGAPSMSDAPTMLQRPVPAEDEFPDPYGVPMPPQGGYAGTQAGGWDAPAGGYEDHGAPEDGYGYGGQQPGAQYGDDGGYGAPAGGARPPAQQRYDEPTGLYQPQDDDQGYAAGGNAYDDRGGYDPAGPQHGGPQHGGPQHGGPQHGAQPYGGGGYGGGQPTGQYGGAGEYEQAPADQGYGSWGAPSGGLDNGSAYGPQSGGAYGAGAGGAAYGAGGGQQYGGGYEQGGYEPPAAQPGQPYGGPGYEQAGHGDQYDEPTGYDDRPGYDQHGQPRPQPTHPAQRRGEWDS